jgi:Ricin-type beta-trefoil lectin domain
MYPFAIPPESTKEPLMNDRKKPLVRRGAFVKTPRPALTPQVLLGLELSASQPAGWTYIVSATGTKAAPLVVNIQGGAPTPGSQIIAYPLKPSSPNELWLFTADGYILSALDSSLCLTVVNGNVVANSVTAYGDSSQLWSLPGNGTIVSQANSQVLAVGDNQFVGVVDFDSSSPPAQMWSYFPNNPLPGILAQAPDPFPVWAPGTDLGNAYAAVMTQLGGNPDFDLRAEYRNLAAPLGAWLSTILAMPLPNGVTSADWNTVQQQLVQELTAAMAVQDLFANYTTCHVALFSSQEAILNKAIDDASILTTSQTSSLFGVIVWSIVYVALEADPDTAVIANIVQGAMNIAKAANDKGVVGTNAFQVEVSALWNLLSEGFDEILQATAAMEKEILSDWGKMQATYAEIIGGGGLAWPTGMTAGIVANSAFPFQTAMLQALLPSQYLIAFTNTNVSIGGPPSCTFETPHEWFEIMAPTNETTFSWPEYMMTNDILANNAVSLDFFYFGQGGWATPMSSGGGPAEALTLMVTNQSNRFVLFSVSQSGMSNYTTAPIAPWQSASFTWKCGSLDGSASVTITDGTGATLATFSIYQADHNGETPEVSGLTVSSGYGLSSPLCRAGYNGYYGASCQATIFAIPATVNQ